MAEETINGVRIWYDEQGSGEPLVLVHASLLDARCFDGNLARLADGFRDHGPSGVYPPFRVFRPEWRGHGHTPDVDGPLSTDILAADLIAFLEQIVRSPARVVGFSAGAVISLLAAVRRPDLIERLVLISGGFHHAGSLRPPSLPTDVPEALYQQYGQVSPDGIGHFPVVIGKVAAMAHEPTLTVAELAAVTARTLVLVGDDDAVTLEHTIALYRGLPQAELAVIPGASHTALLEKPDLCTRLVAEFLTTDATPTFVPIRRALSH